ncbi:hypothetical protein MVEN_00031400 [Mycena venus]|uniref:Uncharacterized protein n=1 Tax=Mycena venus TaxID=2733690 RepID=A0A8H6Z6Z7_9AGAR|nr:hypothetical protein MVEN_00031400 [Mycena venus]
MAASLLTLANEAVTLLAQVEQILIEVDNIGDARTVPIRTIRKLLQTGPLVSAQQRVQNVVHGLHGLVRQEAMLSRLSAASLDNPEKPLLYEQVPNPVYKPNFLPAYLLNVFRNTRPARQPGLIYEATVDRLAGTFFGFYLPPTHQFLLQPQHTFRALAPEDVVAMEAEWSRVVAPGDGSSIRLMSLRSDSPPEHLPLRVAVRARHPQSQHHQSKEPLPFRHPLDSTSLNAWLIWQGTAYGDPTFPSSIKALSTMRPQRR